MCEIRFYDSLDKPSRVETPACLAVVRASCRNASSTVITASEQVLCVCVLLQEHPAGSGGVDGRV